MPPALWRRGTAGNKNGFFFLRPRRNERSRKSKSSANHGKVSKMDIFLSLLWAFLVGGGFCVIAQLLIDLTMLTPARILVLYVCAGVLLGAVGLYEPLFAFAGAGASVPLIGFGGNIARGVREAVAEKGLLGALSGPFEAASVGTTAALVFGYLSAVLFKSKPKRL